MQVLVTGAFGWTASAILEALHQRGHRIRAFDLPVHPIPRHVQQLCDEIILGDIGASAAIAPAVAGMQAILHLAVAGGPGVYKDPVVPFATNVRGTYNLFEAVRAQQIQKVVLLSSAAVHLFSSIPAQLSAEHDWMSSPADDHLYDLTKRLQEVIAHDFATTYGLHVVVLRVGHIVDGVQDVDPHGKPLASLLYARGGWVCRYDVAGACVRALERAGTGYEAFHVLSPTRRAHASFDVERTERELGYRCRTRFEAYE